LEEQQKDLIEASKQKNTPCGDAIDLLWKEIILAKDPKYGDWEYQGQAYRHLKAEYEELQARVKLLEAQVVAVTECRDQTYAQLSKAHERLESLELHFADEIAELEAEANVDAENNSDT
jgi:hypothetical protein